MNTLIIEAKIERFESELQELKHQYQVQPVASHIKDEIKQYDIMIKVLRGLLLVVRVLAFIKRSRSTRTD